MTTITRPTRGAVRKARWAELHVRLWCRSEQCFRPWVRDGYSNVVCGSCGRLLIAEGGE